MPELPEVEVTRIGLLPHVCGRRVTGLAVRNPSLRYPLPGDLGARVVGRTLAGITRRGKYLLFDFETGELLVHLGMSGSLRLVAADNPPDRHDHVDLLFGKRALRLRDPRRFGAMLWLDKGSGVHPLLRTLGMEPLGDGLTGEVLHQALRRRSAAIKQVLMDSHVIVGVGNIYASESLFRAGIRPSTSARRISRARCVRLVEAVKGTLQDALAAGGSSLRDFVGSDGRPGYFQQQHFAYGRAGAPCRVCGAPIRSLRQGQRSTFYCPHCQR